MKKTETKKAKPKAPANKKPKLLTIDKAVEYYIGAAKEIAAAVEQPNHVMNIAKMLQNEAHHQGFKATEDLLPAEQQVV